MASLNLKVLGAFLFGAALFIGVSSALAVGAYPVAVGGTGTTTIAANKLLYGAGTSPIQAVGTTSASCSGGTSCTSFTVIGGSPITITGTSGTVTSIATTWPILGGPITTTGTLTFGGLSTSSAAVVSNIPYFSGVNTFANVATSSHAFSGPFTITGTLGALVGGLASTVTWNGLATTSQPSSSNLLVSNGAAGVYGVATTSETCTAPLSCTAHAVLTGGGAISLGTVGLANGGTATTTGGVTNGVEYYNGTYLTNGAGFVFDGTRVGIASSTPTYTLSINTSGSDFYVKSTGETVAYDTTNTWQGQLSPTRSLVLTTGTTTAWAATTSAPYIPEAVAPFAGTLKQARCHLDQSFLGVEIDINGTAVTPTYFVASTTVGLIKFTGGNTFSAGDRITAKFGTTTTAATLSADCTLDTFQTP